MLLATGHWERTVWHYASMRDKEEILHKIWEFVKEVVTTEELKKDLLLGKEI